MTSAAEKMNILPWDGHYVGDAAAHEKQVAFAHRAADAFMARFGAYEDHPHFNMIARNFIEVCNNLRGRCGHGDDICEVIATHKSAAMEVHGEKWLFSDASVARFV